MLIFPLLQTPRLNLRQLSVDDIPTLVSLANNKKVSQYILNKPYPYQEHHAVFRMSYVVQGFKNKNRFIFAIELKEKEPFIGEISLHLEQPSKAQLAYWLGEPFWNRGITTEAISAVLKFGFEQLKLDNIYATCHVNNKASSIVLNKNELNEVKTTGNVTLFELKSSDYTINND